MMDIDKLIEDLRRMLKQYGEKIPYGELVGAPWPYSRAGDLVWQDPEPYFIEQAATALSTLQAENEQLRAELEEASKLIKEQEEFHNKSLEIADKATAQSSEFLDDLKRMKQERDAAVAELEQVKREKSSIEQDFRAFAKQWWEEDSGFPCRWCKFERQGGCEWKVKHPGEICAGRAFEWRGQKEG